MTARCTHMPKETIVALGPLAPSKLDAVVPSFLLAWPLEDSSGFLDLLRAIDEADARLNDHGPSVKESKPSARS